MISTPNISAFTHSAIHSARRKRGLGAVLVEQLVSQEQQAMRISLQGG
jgi:predicted GNAT family acetyltransferase